MESQQRKIISITAALAVMFIGASVIVGWLTHNDFLRYVIISPGAVKMKFNVALGFVFSSVVLMLYHFPAKKPKIARGISIGLSIIIFLMGFLTLAEYVFSIDIEIDELFVQDELPTTATYYAGRMSPISAVNFILISLGLLSLNREKTVIYQFIYLSFIGFISLVTLIGINFITDIPTFIRLAVHVSVGFFTLSVAIYFAQPILQQKITFEQRMVTGFVASIILISMISVLTFFYTDKLVGASQSVEHTKNVLSETEQILSLVKDIESGGRGYIITQDSLYLNHFITARKSVYDHLINLNDLTRDRQSQKIILDSLSAFINKRITFSLELIRLRNESGFEAAHQLVLTRRGNFITDRIRQLITSLQAEENDLLVQRQKSSAKSNIDFSNAFRTFIASVLILLTVVFFFVRVNYAARRKAEMETRRMNDQLEQRVAERTLELRKSEKLFRAMIEKNADMITLASPEGQLQYVSPSLTTILGFTSEEYTSRPAFEFIHPEDVPGLVDQIKTLMSAAGKTFYRQQRLLHRDGTWRWCEGTVTNMLHDPEIGALVSNFRDITDRKKAEDQLRKAETSYREIFDKATDAVYIHEVNTGKVIQVNDRAAEVTGYTKRELLNTDPQEFVTDNPDYTFQHALAYIQKAALGQPQHFEWLGKKKDGSSNWFEVNLKRAKIAGEERILAFFREINDRKKAQAEIEHLNKNLEAKVTERTEQLAAVNSELETNIKQVKESEEKFSKIFDANPVGISMSILPSGKIIDANRSFLKMYGFNFDEVVDHTAIELNMVENELREGLLREMRQGGKIRDKEIAVRNKAGAEFPILFSIDSFATADQQFVITFSYDITDRKRAEEQINQLNIDLEANLQQLKAANKEMESFTYSVSHDLRSPLRAIDGYARMLEEDFLEILNDEGKRQLATIQYNAKKMGNLIDDLLSFSRLGKQDLRKTTVNMKQLAENVLHDMNNQLNPKAEIKIGNLHPIQGDQSLINQVFVNLLSNAIKYSSKKERPLIEVQSRLNETEIVYSVKDNGAGFDMQYADKLFGVFQRLHKAKEFDGTGVGLAIAQRIIIKHSGRIWAEAKPEEGATFFFSLPII